MTLAIAVACAGLGVAWGPVLATLIERVPRKEPLRGAAVAWTLLLLVHLISPRGMGFGDVRLSFILGLYLGWLGAGHVALGLFLGFLLGSVAGIALVIVRRRSRKEAIPFGPFLAA